MPVTARNTAAVTFRACNGSLSHNQIWFGLNSLTLQVVQTAFSCYDAGNDVRNLVIVGNQGHYYDDTLADSENRLLSEDNDGLQLIRAAISGNTMGGSGDSNWYITVGDGENSIGDVNGEFAIQNIVKYFYKINTGSGHGGVVIYVKYGNYTIDDKTDFIPSANGLTVALVGLTDNGNFPTINLDVSSPDTDGQELLFSHHIENMHFNGGLNYYKIVIQNDFSNPDIRIPFFRNVEIKNCTFHNCSIVFDSASVSTVLNEKMKNEILIEHCQFSNSEVISNMAAPEDMYAIVCDNKNGKIIINTCQTVYREWRGQFFKTLSPIDSANNCQVYIDNCVLTSEGMTSSAAVFAVLCFEVNTFSFTNNIIDLTLVHPTTISNGIYAKFITDSNFETSLNITNNIIIGNNGTVSSVAAELYGAEKLNISKNTFKGFHLCVELIISYYTSSAFLYSLNYNIDKNRFTSSSRSYGFLSITNLSGSLGNVLTGEINVNDNALDYSSQGTSFSTVENFNTMKAPINLSVKSPIGTGTDDIQVNIKNNKIRKFKGTLSTVSYTECCISVLGATSCNIIGNDINHSNSSSSGEFNVIYVSNNGVGWSTIGNVAATAAIQQNRLESDGSSGNNSSFIFVRNLGSVAITENLLKRINGTQILYNIKAYNEGDLSLTPALCLDGVISNNTLDIFSVNDLKLKDSSYTSNAVKLTVGVNKNLSVEKEVDCTHFMVYGYNRVFTTNGQEMATVMWNDTSFISTTPSDKQIHIIDDSLVGSGVANSSWNLPNGLYWTNATSLTEISPSLPITLADYNTIGADNKHQVIVPINIPEFCKIEKISIPIFIRNDSGSTETFNAGAAAIVGNHVAAFGARIYELNSSSTFSSSSVSVATNSDSILTLESLYSEFFDRLTGTTDQTPMPTDLQLYVVISLYINGEYTSINDFYFAIPYVKVQYAY